METTTKPPMSRELLQRNYDRLVSRILVGRGHELGPARETAPHILQGSCLTCGAVLTVDGHLREAYGPAHEAECEHRMGED